MSPKENGQSDSEHNYHFRKKLLEIPVQRFGCADKSEAGWVLVDSYISKTTANTESALGMGNGDFKRPGCLD